MPPDVLSGDIQVKQTARGRPTGHTLSQLKHKQPLARETVLTHTRFAVQKTCMNNSAGGNCGRGLLSELFAILHFAKCFLSTSLVSVL